MRRAPILDNPQTFPFGIDFQRSLLLLITKDKQFASVVIQHLKVDYFENDVLKWAYNYLLEYREKYSAIPNINVILEETRVLDSSIKELFRITLEGVLEADLSSVDWLKDKTIEFIKRNLFVKSFQESKEKYNSGSVTEAYDVMMEALEAISKTSWGTEDREWFFEDFNQRMADRLAYDPSMDSISTGIPELDKVLGGGLSIGEVGDWLAYAKRGKTTLLTNHGVQAIRRGLKRVVHFVLEGTRSLVANRYDTIFAQEDYSIIKSGAMTNEVYEHLHREYEMFSEQLVIRGFTDNWEHTIIDLHNELRDLERLNNFRPELLIIDYGDLLDSRTKVRTEEAKQRSVFQDIKTLSGRGYAIWTASQAQRPKNDIETDDSVLSFRNVADCYAKVQKIDFMGSINQTKEERDGCQARLFAELYRDNEAGIIIPVYADFSKMTIKGLRENNIIKQQQPIQLGYKNGVQQVKAPFGSRN